VITTWVLTIKRWHLSHDRNENIAIYAKDKSLEKLSQGE
jgi:hypothetical protein